MSTLSDFQQSDTREWRIEWENNESGPDSRTTTLPLIAWFAKEHDSDATVHALYEDDTEVML